jgi:hypothetical protein
MQRGDTARQKLKACLLETGIGHDLGKLRRAWKLSDRFRQIRVRIP